MGRKRTSRARGKNQQASGAGAGNGTEAGASVDSASVDSASAAPGSVEHVAVEVDRAAILQEAAAAAADATLDAPAAPPPDAPATGADAPALAPLDPAAKAADVQPAVRFLAAQLFTLAAPAWDVTDDESNAVADSAALVLAYWMPDGAIDPKYLALMSLAGSLWAVAAKRRTADGRWFPLKKKPAPAPAPTPPAPAAGNVTQLRV